MIYWVQVECTVNQGKGNFIMDSLWKTNNWKCSCSSYWMDLGPLAPTRWAVRTLTSLGVYNALLGSSTFFSIFYPSFLANKLTNIILSPSWRPGHIKPLSISVCWHRQSNSSQHKVASAQPVKINNTLFMVDVKYEINEKNLDNVTFSSNMYLTTDLLYSYSF